MRGARVVAVIVVALLAATPTVAAPALATATATPPAIAHVFVINLENENYDTSFATGSVAPYLRETLPRRGLLLTQYFGITHDSLGNYVAQISGQGPTRQTQRDCGRFTDFVSAGMGALGQALGHGCVYPRSVTTIADQLTASGKTWKGYMEDMATPCRHPAIGAPDRNRVATANSAYATRHDPFVYFHSIIDAPACRANVVALDRLRSDLASASRTPNLAYITPNLCNDGHDATCPGDRPGGLGAANTWLRRWVPRILRSPAFREDGLLVVTFDEAEAHGSGADASACCHAPTFPNVEAEGVAGPSPGGGRVGAVLVSRFIAPGSTSDTPYNHFSLLCSMEDVFGLEHLGYAAAPGLQCFGPDVYTKASG
jgi:hypothetical protein